MAKTFHHIGLPTDRHEDDWFLVSSTGTWISNPAHHPQRIEWLHYSPESRLDARFRERPHVAYAVDDLEAEVAGKPVVLGPMEVGEPPFCTAAFTDEDGLLIEYMQFHPGRMWFDDPVQAGEC